MGKIKKKPFLIVVEGPAGSGKTTLQNYLFRTLSDKDNNVGILPEFSNSEMGKLIQNNSYFENKNPSWLTGINGLLVFLADKIQVLEEAKLDLDKTWICDRFITSQFVLGMRSIKGEEDRLFCKDLLQKFYNWSLEMISEQSIFIFMNNSLETLKNRLEKRINRELTEQELINLEYEINEYRQIADLFSSKNVIVINGKNTLESIGNNILHHINSSYKK